MSEGGVQNSKDIAILFAAGSNDPLQAGAHFCPLFGAEAAAHVLLDFCRAQAAFGLIVGERDIGCQREGRNSAFSDCKRGFSACKRAFSPCRWATLPSSSTSRLRKTLISSDCSATWVVYQNSGKRAGSYKTRRIYSASFFY
jgi:hypothetical protein